MANVQTFLIDVPFLIEIHQSGTSEPHGEREMDKNIIQMIQIKTHLVRLPLTCIHDSESFGTNVTSNHRKEQMETGRNWKPTLHHAAIKMRC